MPRKKEQYMVFKKEYEKDFIQRWVEQLLNNFTHYFIDQKL